MFTVENGNGLTNANTYATIAEADVYHDFNFYGTSWEGYTDDQKQKALVTATKFIDSEFLFVGTRKVSTQALEFPRYADTPEVIRFLARYNYAETYIEGVPKLLKDATADLAQAIAKADRETIANAAESSGSLRSVSIGAISVGFGGDSSSSSSSDVAQTITTNTVRRLLAPLIRPAHIIQHLPRSGR